MQNKTFEQRLQERKYKYFIIITLINKEKIEKGFNDYEELRSFEDEYKKHNKDNIESVTVFI